MTKQEDIKIVSSEQVQKEPKKEFNQAKNIIRAAYLLVTSLTFLAWNSYFQGSLAGFSVPSLLGLIAFGYMWVHYLSGYIKQNFQPELDTKLSFKVTQWIVLVAFIAHPFWIIFELNKQGYGLPPESYKSFFGATRTAFIFLGATAWTGFLLFEFKKILKRWPKVWSAVLKFNDLAMLLIIIHGFKLGFVISSGWFRHVWLAYGLSLIFFYYDKYVQKKLLKKYTEVFILALGLLAIFFLSMGIKIGGDDSRTKLNKTPESQQESAEEARREDEDEGYIFLAQLAKNDGLKGRDCWVAVDGEVYDVTGSSEWKDGEHTPSRGQAKCGQDLTQAIKQSPHGGSILGGFPIIGELRNE